MNDHLRRVTPSYLAAIPPLLRCLARINFRIFLEAECPHSLQNPIFTKRRVLDVDVLSRCLIGVCLLFSQN